ncbi:hypothetical protein SH661x_003364 [Planctomicrobium sp. SH661]|uniref:hypothetical protein n=1 Tax=Planctomicrobium sp. SH661 TaxID=3448124 RepID=UPI003F5C4169
MTLSVASMVAGLGSSECLAQAGRYGYDGFHGYVPSYGWGGYGYGGGMTAAMGAGIGIGAAAQGLGQAEVDQGQYEIEHTQAESQYLQAYQEYLKTVNMQRQFYDVRQQAIMDQYQAKTKEARAQVEAYKKDMAARAAPHRLSSEQFDRQNNVITWPGVLRATVFDEDRYEIDKLFSQRTAGNSGAGSDNCAAIEKATDKMMKAVSADINNLDVDQFITAKHFIGSLAYEARFTVNGAPAPENQ